MSRPSKISFIGAGRMAEAIIAGIIRKKLFSPDRIFIADKDPKRVHQIASQFKVNTAVDNKDAVLISDVVVLAVKPQKMKEVLSEIRTKAQNNQVFISIAAGVTLQTLEKELPVSSVIRVMPNNPCLVCEGMTAVCGGKNVSKSDVKLAEKIFSTLGLTIVLEEKYFDGVTGLSGSGPAYVYRVIEGLIEGGTKAGLMPDEARLLAEQTVLGAVKTFIDTRKTPKELIEMVSSPGGTTIEGLKVFDEAKLNSIIADAVLAAAQRSKELAKELGK